MSAVLALILPAAAGAYALSRRLHGSPFAAAYAGALYVLCGPFLVRAGAVPLLLPAALLPWALVMADRAAGSPGWRGLPPAFLLALGILLCRVAGSGADASLVVAAVALAALFKRPRRPAGLALVVGTLALSVGLLLELGGGLFAMAPDLPPPTERVASAVFPYERPGTLTALPPAHVGVVALSLALLAILGLPPGRTLGALALAAGAVFLWRGPLLFLDPLPLAPYGLAMAMLAAQGLDVVRDGLARPSLVTRNALSLVAGVFGLLSFHLIGLYLRGGHRPGEAPGIALGAAFAAASLAAAVTPIIAILKGAWDERRRAMAAAIAAASLLDLAASAITHGGPR